jgi:4-hydroxyphenylpyruvate dioxygenase
MTTITENLPTPSNPMGISGLEFIEFATSQPLALGALLAQFGFVATARHRSREVVLYQHLGTLNTASDNTASDKTANKASNIAAPLNIVVNAATGLNGQTAPAVPSLSAMAFRVANAAQAHATACQLGAWDIPTRARAMELNIPGIHGAGDSVIYFVDRFAGNAAQSALTIYDVDFVPLPHEQRLTEKSRAEFKGLHFFGIVQAVQAERSNDWIDFYTHLFGFTVKADERHGNFDGVLPKGVVMVSPCKSFHLQLIEPPAGADDIVWDEGLIRIGLGAPDVLATTQALQNQGVKFVDVGAVKPSAKGALSHTYLGGVTLELVQSSPQPASPSIITSTLTSGQ